MTEQTLIVAAPSGLRAGDVIIEVSIGGDPDGPRMVWVRRPGPGQRPAERIRYAEAAIIALDDAARTQDAFDVGQQLARAQAFATLAGAEQARISNLIAWKRLRQSASPSTLPGSGDAITQEIEAALGITDPGAEDSEPPIPQRVYPYADGPHLILGPEIFTGDGDEVPQDVIAWRGAAYRLIEEAGA